MGLSTTEIKVDASPERKGVSKESTTYLAPPSSTGIAAERKPHEWVQWRLPIVDETRFLSCANPSFAKAVGDLQRYWKSS